MSEIPTYPDEPQDMVSRESMVQAFDELGKRHENQLADLKREIEQRKIVEANLRAELRGAEDRIEELEADLNKAGRLVLGMLFNGKP